MNQAYSYIPMAHKEQLNIKKKQHMKTNGHLLHGNDMSFLKLLTYRPAKHLSVKAAREKVASAFFFTPRCSTNHPTVTLSQTAQTKTASAGEVSKSSQLLLNVKNKPR